MFSARQESADSKRRRRSFVVGCAVAIVVMFGMAEAYLRWFPPRDLYPHLGEESPLTGHYALDDDFGVGFRSWEEFQHENGERLAGYLPFHSARDSRPMWALFGNSFVQAPGMLADYCRASVADRQIFNLGRNEHLYLRMAQIKLLLAHGMAPERILFALMPVDVVGLGMQPLATNVVTKRGAIIFSPRRFGPPMDWLTDHSRLAFIATVRAGLQVGNPRFNRNTLYDGIDEQLLVDLRSLFGNLAKITRSHDVPVTVLLIPAYHQIHRGASCAFQDTLGQMLREQGFDVFDPRVAYRSQPDPEGLFIPDKHFSPRGNEILLHELVAHVRRKQTSPDTVAGLR